MTLKELVDVLSKPETRLDVYGPKGEKVYKGTKNSLLRYPAIMNCPIKKMEVMSGELFIVLQNMPSGDVQPIANPEGYKPPEKKYVTLPPIDEYLIDNGISPNLIHMQGGKHYVIAFKEVEDLVKKWYREKNRRDASLTIIIDPISKLPAIDLTYM